MADPNDLSMPLVPVTVLVVDDRSMARRIVARTLSEEGCRVLEADGMREALEVLAQARGRVDLVMIDIVLADGDGVKLSRRIREEWLEQRFLFMSGFAAEVMARYGLENLDVPFLAKPSTRNELLGRVWQVLGRPAVQPSRSEARAERDHEDRG